MTRVITDKCINTKDRSCVSVCPVDCIHPVDSEDSGEHQLYIDPDVCIDCGACEAVCPVQAIYPEEELPEDQKVFVEINKDYYKLSKEEFRAKWEQFYAK
jgi:NAD-dependent dihydropyrimidine dehydrogenase PreA subunit